MKPADIIDRCVAIDKCKNVAAVSLLCSDFYNCKTSDSNKYLTHSSQKTHLSFLFILFLLYLLHLIYI